MPRNLVSPLQVAFLALAMTSNVINPFVSWDVRFLGNSVWTSNNGFMGNLPYGYPEYSLPSSITNRTLRWLRHQINGSNHEKMNIFIKMPTIFNLDHTNGQTWWCVGNTKLRYSLKKKITVLTIQIAWIMPIMFTTLNQSKCIGLFHETSLFLIKIRMLMMS
jgi:hypothetical protein